MIRTPPPETKLSKQLETLRVSMKVYNRVQVYDDFMVYSFKGGSVKEIVKEFNNKINQLALDLIATSNWLTNTILIKEKI